MVGNPPVLTQIGPNWTGPGSLAVQNGSNPYFPNEHYSITRMGLPERPLLAGEQILQGQQTTPNSQPTPQTPYYVYQPSAPYTYGSFGLNRDLAVRQIASGNGFYAGIANPFNAPNGVVQVDPFLAFCGTAQPLPTAPSPFLQWNNTTAYSVGNIVAWNATNYYCISPNTNSQPPNTNWQNAIYYTLYDNLHAQPWPTTPQLSSYYQVRIVGGTGAGQVRTITGNTGNLLTVTPSWSIPITDNTSVYEIGWANSVPGNPSAGPQNATWCAQLYPIPPPLVTPAAGAPGNVVNGGKWLTDNSGKATWTANQFQGKYVTTGAGQARAIVSNTGSAQDNSVTPPTPPYTLVVTPAFTVPGSQNYIITESYGYVLITSGRASNRLFSIAWDAVDPAGQSNGHLIVCAGTDFTSLTGITAAQRGNQYNLQNATAFTVIGNYSQSQLTWPLGSTTAPYPSMPLILNAVPDGSPIVSWTPQPLPALYCPPWFNTMNVVNAINAATQLNSNPYRVALDQYNVPTQGAGLYTSEYNYGVIFSDSGPDPSLPVRVDVLVWRNFDTTKDFVENQKPVGHMTGYIKRP
jgi:hypothetical protein